MFLPLPSKTSVGVRPASVSAVSDSMWSYCSESDKTPSAKSEQAGRRRQATSSMWEYCSSASEGEDSPQATRPGLSGTTLAIHDALPTGNAPFLLHDDDSDDEEHVGMATSIYNCFEQDWQRAACVRHRSTAKSTVRHRSSSGRSSVQRQDKFSKSKRARTSSEPACKKIGPDDPGSRMRGKSANAVLSRKQGQAAVRAAKAVASPRRPQDKPHETTATTARTIAFPAHIQKIVDALPQDSQRAFLQQLARKEQEISHLRSVVQTYEDIHTTSCAA